MKNRILQVALIALAPVVAWADDFDITMDVVGADESFDEVIVNRIALPFSGREGSRVDQQAVEGESSDSLLDNLGEMLDPALESDEPGAGSIGELDSMIDAGSMVPSSGAVVDEAIGLPR